MSVTSPKQKNVGSPMESSIYIYIDKLIGLLSLKLVLIQGDKYIRCFMRFFVIQIFSWHKSVHLQ